MGRLQQSMESSSCSSSSDVRLAHATPSCSTKHTRCCRRLSPLKILATKTPPGRSTCVTIVSAARISCACEHGTPSRQQVSSSVAVPLFPSAHPRQHLQKNLFAYTGRTDGLCGKRCFPRRAAWCPMHALHTFSHALPSLPPTCTYSSRSCSPVTSGAPSHTTRSAGWPSKCEITCSHSEQS